MTDSAEKMREAIKRFHRNCCYPEAFDFEVDGLMNELAALSASGTKSDGGGGAQFVEGYFTDQYAAGAKPPVGPSDPIPSQPDPAPIAGLEPVAWRLAVGNTFSLSKEKVFAQHEPLFSRAQLEAHAAEQVRPLVEALEGLIEAVELDADEGLEGIGSYTGARLTDAKNAIRARGQV